MPEVRVELRDTTNNVVGDIEIFDSNSFPLALTYSNFDARNIKDRKGSFSKSFKIPATKSNNNLFGQIYFDGFADTKNMKGRKDATIYVDNLPILSGQLQVTKILKGESVEEYECVFFGDNMDWASKIKDAKMKSLLFDNTDGATLQEDGQGNETYQYIYDNIVASWAHTYANTIVYPLCSVGEGDNTQNGVMDSDFIPHIFIRSVWDKIFKSINPKYTVSSTFCTSPLFNKLVMPLNFERSRDMIDDWSGKASRNTNEQLINVYYNNSATQSRATITSNIQGLEPFTKDFWFKANIEDDPQNSGTDFSVGNIRDIETTNSATRFIVGQDGSYDAKINIDIEVDVDVNSWDVSGTVNFEIHGTLLKVVSGAGETLETHTIQDFNISKDDYIDGLPDKPRMTLSHDVNISGLQVGDEIRYKIHLNHLDYASSNGGNYQLNVVSGSSMEVVASPNVALGEPYSASDMLASKKQIEFIKGVAQPFNLQFHTDAASRTVYVEPYDNFFHPKTQALDWSDKIDYSRGVEEEFIHDIKKNIILSYSGDEDGVVERFNKRNSHIFGAYEETDTTGTFFDGEFKIYNPFFAPTFMIYEGDYVQDDISSSPLIPTYWSSYSPVAPSLFHERPDKSFDVGSRLLIYKGDVSSGSTKFHYVGTEVGGTPTSKTSWGRAIFTDWDDTAGTISDGFQNIPYNLSFTSYDVNGTTFHGLYKAYYAKMIEQLKQRPRIKSAYFNLQPTDVMNFDFRTLVYINGIYYRVNKIVDYKPHRNETTKVELVEFTERGSGTINTESDTFLM